MTDQQPCRWNPTTKTRLLPTHKPGCETPGCAGCQPCLERHCQVCNRTHVTYEGRGTDRTCATCLSETRTHIKHLGIMATALLGEALLRNLNSDAAALAGPVADVEVWTYRRLSAIGQRIDPKWLDDQVDLHHPAWVLGTWERQTRLHLGQVVSPGTSKPTLTEAREYLDRHLTRLAHDPAFGFTELAVEIRDCHHHVERVLALDEHIDRGAPCPACGKANLEKSFGTDEHDDKWTCPRCGQWWSDTDYRRRVANDYLANATALTAADLQRAHRVPVATVRKWVQREQLSPLGHRDHSGRQLFDVAKVKALRDAHATPQDEAATA